DQSVQRLEHLVFVVGHGGVLAESGDPRPGPSRAAPILTPDGRAARDETTRSRDATIRRTGLGGARRSRLGAGVVAMGRAAPAAPSLGNTTRSERDERRAGPAGSWFRSPRRRLFSSLLSLFSFAWRLGLVVLSLRLFSFAGMATLARIHHHPETPSMS